MSSPVKHFLSLSDWSDAELNALIDQAQILKQRNYRSKKSRRQGSGTAIFQSLTAHESLFLKLPPSTLVPAHPLSLREPVPGPLRPNFGAVMNGNKTEHLKEAIQVLSRYCDAIGVRAFFLVEK